MGKEITAGHRHTSQETGSLGIFCILFNTFRCFCGVNILRFSIESPFHNGSFITILPDGWVMSTSYPAFMYLSVFLSDAIFHLEVFNQEMHVIVELIKYINLYYIIADKGSL